MPFDGAFVKHARFKMRGGEKGENERKGKRGYWPLNLNRLFWRNNTSSLLDKEKKKTISLFFFIR